MKLAWTYNSRLDLLWAVSTLSQVIEEDLRSRLAQLVKKANRLLLYARENQLKIVFELPDWSYLQIIGFSDVFFENNVDNSNHLGFIIFLLKRFKIANKIHFKFYKARRIVRSVPSWDLIAFVDMF